jgi:hypothetical protein
MRAVKLSINNAKTSYGSQKRRNSQSAWFDALANPRERGRSDASGWKKDHSTILRNQHFAPHDRAFLTNTIAGQAKGALTQFVNGLDLQKDTRKIFNNMFELPDAKRYRDFQI